MLEAKRDLFFDRVELEDNHFHLVSDGEHLRGVDDPAPGHIGDVEQSVHTAQVDEDPVIGDVLDKPLDARAFLEDGQGLLAALLPVHFQQGPARQDDISAFLVEFEDFELELLSDQLVQIPHGPQIDLGPREKGLDAEIHRQAPFDPGGNHALDRSPFLKDTPNSLPYTEFFGFLLGEHHHTVGVLDRFEKHLDLISNLGLQLTVFVGKFFNINLSLGFVTDIHGDKILLKSNNLPLDDLMLLEMLKAFLEKFGEIDIIVDKYGVGFFLGRYGGLILLLDVFGCHGWSLLFLADQCPRQSRLAFILDESLF